MAGQEYNEKEEKVYDEKEVLKHEEKVEQRDPLSTAIWAIILIWAGVVFLAVNTGWTERLFRQGFFKRILPSGMEMFEPSTWSIILLGAGVILLVETILRLILSQYHRHIGGSLITGAVFIGIGLGNWFGWDLVWPIVVIAVGVSILVGGLLKKRE